jgi:ABC-type nitrate/sulfonate/bicarbonate transport system substrate-binding protein
MSRQSAFAIVYCRPRASGYVDANIEAPREQSVPRELTANKTKNRIARQNLMMTRKALVIAVAIFLGGFSCATTRAQSVRVALPGISGTLLPLYVGQEKRLFKKYGLDSELILVRSGSIAVQSLLAGEIQYAASGTSSGIEAKIAGADMISITDYMNTLPYTLVTSDRIQSAAQLKGKRFAVSRLGAISDIALRLALKSLGVDPTKDAVILGIGDAAARFAALKAGSVDATVISPPDTLTARKLGFKLLTSFQDAGIKFAYGSIFITSDYGRKNRSSVLSFMRGFTEAIAYLRMNKEDTLSVLSKWTRNSDRDALEDTYDFFLRLYPPKPYSLDEAVKAVLDVLAEKNAGVKKFKPGDFYDMQYLREIDESGFIDRFYR